MSSNEGTETSCTVQKKVIKKNWVKQILIKKNLIEKNNSFTKNKFKLSPKIIFFLCKALLTEIVQKNYKIKKYCEKKCGNKKIIQKNILFTKKISVKKNMSKKVIFFYKIVVSNIYRRRSG